MKINTCTLQTLAAVNRFLPETHGDHRALETIDDLIVPLVMHGVNHELIAFLHMSQVIRICPMARAFSSHMQLDNPFHGYVLWYLVLDYLCYCAKTFSFPIPGLSTTDAVGTGLSSCDKVMILAAEKKAEMVAAMQCKGFTEPNMDNWFYRLPGEAAVTNAPLLDLEDPYLLDESEGLQRAAPEEDGAITGMASGSQDASPGMASESEDAASPSTSASKTRSRR